MGKNQSPLGWLSVTLTLCIEEYSVLGTCRLTSSAVVSLLRILVEFILSAEDSFFPDSVFLTSTLLNCTLEKAIKHCFTSTDTAFLSE